MTLLGDDGKFYCGCQNCVDGVREVFPTMGKEDNNHYVLCDCVTDLLENLVNSVEYLETQLEYESI